VPSKSTVRALTVVPGRAGSTQLREIAAPTIAANTVLARTLAIGICGTDREILSGAYGRAPSGQDYLVIGHESLAEVVESPQDCELEPRDLIAAFVRCPDPVPCEACRASEWDMCTNGLYTEHGIKERDGFCVERFRIDPQRAIRLSPTLRDTGVLLEPTSVVAKAWDHIERIGQRTASWRASRVLVTGAGPIGLLAALLAQQRGYELHVYDHNHEGRKKELVEKLGSQYHSESIDHALSLEPNIVIECTGAAEVVAKVMSRNARDGIVCLAGLSSGAHRVSCDFSELNREMVLENDVVFGSVNANRRHYTLAAAALARADAEWLRSLITRRVALKDWQQAFERRDDDIKVVIDFTLAD
jgi:threonine dehydrogenase-like Zn-dependent dehydrogenase